MNQVSQTYAPQEPSKPVFKIACEAGQRKLQHLVLHILGFCLDDILMQLKSLYIKCLGLICE